MLRTEEHFRSKVRVFLQSLAIHHGREGPGEGVASR